MLYFKNLKDAKAYAKKNPEYKSIWFNSSRKMYYLSCI